MDLLSLAVGFLIGGFTGATGTYLGNKFTDQRRASEAKKFADADWQKLKKKFPAIIDEMIEDINGQNSIGVRKFFVTQKGVRINKSEPAFEYYSDVHPDLHAAIMYMEDLGYIEDITPGNCPMYRFYEHFYDLLKQRA